jgi:hypothetical protein
MAAVSDEHENRFEHDISQRKRGTVEKWVQIILLTATGNVSKTRIGEYKRLKEFKE